MALQTNAEIPIAILKVLTVMCRAATWRLVPSQPAVRTEPSFVYCMYDVTIVPLACRENYFRCTSGECLPQKYKCDTIAHCADGSDETVPCGKLFYTVD